MTDPRVTIVEGRAVVVRIPTGLPGPAGRDAELPAGAVDGRVLGWVGGAAAWVEQTGGEVSSADITDASPTGRAVLTAADAAAARASIGAGTSDLELGTGPGTAMPGDHVTTWDDVGERPAEFPPSAHAHPASDITSGVFSPARLGAGAADATTFLRGDGSWQVPPSAGGGSAFELRGTGMPQGAVAAPPGTYYTDTAGTAGAWRWLKTSGTGTSGWVVVYGDTGWRNVSSLCDPAVLGTGTLRVRRDGTLVQWKYIGGGTPGAPGKLMDIATEFQPDSQPWDRPVAQMGRHGQQATVTLNLGGVLAWASDIRIGGSGGADSATSGYLSYLVNRSWPVSLPGVPG